MRRGELCLGIKIGIVGFSLVYNLFAPSVRLSVQIENLHILIRYRYCY